MTETSATAIRLRALAHLGQQVWLDELARDQVVAGQLAGWIAHRPNWQNWVATASISIQSVTTCCTQH